MSEKDIDWFMRGLARAWSTLDGAQIAVLHDEPCMLATAAGGRVFRDRAAVQGALERILDFYRSQSVASVELVERCIELPAHLPIPAFATVQGRWRLWNSGGAPILGFSTSQILRRGTDGWRVSATANHDERERFLARQQP
jgi:hypothetical protein